MIDYEPTVEYGKRLNQISRAVGTNDEPKEDETPSAAFSRSKGLWRTLLEEKQKQDSLALTRVMTSHEAAKNLDSPRGLMLHGEVGTGKSMLIDLFADCLPSRKKRRWHFNTFMLDTISKLEHLRRSRLSRSLDVDQEDHSLLWLARDMITTSPVLFLDEFQLPDRAASKIMTNLMTSFFQLGGVLIATSNRMPEELHKAAGVTFSPPPSRLDSLRWRIGMGSTTKGRSESMFAGNNEFADFLDVLKARCDVWEIEGKKDYRREESGTEAPMAKDAEDSDWVLDDHQDLQASPTRHKGFSADTAISHAEETSGAPQRADSVMSAAPLQRPRQYLIAPDVDSAESTLVAFADALAQAQRRAVVEEEPYWQPASMRVYGRTVTIPKVHGGTTRWTFDELCCTSLGPADYITLASKFHTLILTDVPILTFLKKNEARRFITLLDALYEARCKLLISAAAGPDELFFPDQATKAGESDDNDAVHSETFSEAFQDATAPFRPNISTQNPDYREPEYVPSPEPDYTHARLQGMLAPDSLEDDPPNRVRGDRGPIDPDDSRMIPRRPNFAATGAFTGEDEKFAYKRARSRLWEMCGAKWWARDEEGWHKPVPPEVRRWERPMDEISAITGRIVEEVTIARDVGVGASSDIDEQRDEVLFRHGASPFRTAREPPPKFSWTHVWGTMKWGKKAGAWGQGVEGLKDRKKDG